MNTHMRNRDNLISGMEENSVFLLSSGQLKHKNADEFFPFQVNKNFYYFTGIKEEDLVLMIVKGDKNAEAYLFIQETTEFMKLWIGEKTSKEEASKLSGIPVKNIFYLKSFDQMFYSMMCDSPRIPGAVPTILYLDMFRVNKDTLPDSYLQFQSIIEKYKELNIKSLDKQINMLRMIKSNQEVDALRNAINITDKGLYRIMDSLKLRNNERQVVADFVHEITLNESNGTGFPTIMASGKNACILHYEDNDSSFKNGDLMLCDLGASKDEYSADISRTYPVSGKFSDRQKDIYNIVLDCNKKCIEFSTVGKTMREIHEYSVKLLTEGCKKLGLIKEDNEIRKYYAHSIGHYLGLDVHDVGVSGVVLQEGMVITIEPGLYIKEEGVGVRIEDNVLITEEGPINLSEAIIKEIDDIEEYMSE